MQSDTPETDAKITEWENLVGGEDIMREYVEVVLLESHAELERKRDEACKLLTECKNLLLGRVDRAHPIYQKISDAQSPENSELS